MAYKRREFSARLTPHLLPWLRPLAHNLHWNDAIYHRNRHQLVKVVHTQLGACGERIVWRKLSCNPDPAVMQFLLFLRATPDNINWRKLSRNPHPEAVKLLQENPDKIAWYDLCENTSDWAIDMLMQEPNDDRLSGWRLVNNSNPRVIALMCKHFRYNSIDSAMWQGIHSHQSAEAMALLREYPDNIIWVALSSNPHPSAVELLREHPAEIKWDMLSRNRNPTAMDLLRDNIDKISWYGLSVNPAIFVDYCVGHPTEAIREHMRGPITEELMARMWHPSRMKRFRDFGEEIDAEDFDAE